MTQHGDEYQLPDGRGDQPPPLPRPGGPGGGLPEVIPPYQPPAQGGHGAQVPREAEEKLESYFGQVDRVGLYPLARVTRIAAGCSTVRLDLREVMVPGESIEIRLAAWMSTIRLAVLPGTEVALQVNASLGDARLEVDGRSQGAEPTGSRVVITGWSTMTDVRVRAFALRDKPRSAWRWTRPK